MRKDKYKKKNKSLQVFYNHYADLVIFLINTRGIFKRYYIAMFCLGDKKYLFAEIIHKLFQNGTTNTNCHLLFIVAIML